MIKTLAEAVRQAKYAECPKCHEIVKNTPLARSNHFLTSHHEVPYSSWETIEWIGLVSVDVLKPLAEAEKAKDDLIQKLHERILSLYQTADHLSHEDERNSCAHILKEFFNAETEEGTFGGLFLKGKEADT
jgi:hypothetical protein